MWVAVGDINGGAGSYTSLGGLVECVTFPVANVDTSSGVGSTRIRFRFESDGNTSDQDGGYPSDGAVIIDSITVQCWDVTSSGATLVTTFYEDFEDETPGDLVTSDGCWAAEAPSGYAKMAAVYDGLFMVQEDLCVTNVSKVFAFIDDPANANYACAGFPTQGVVPYEDADGLYIFNGIWSPPIPFTGVGSQVILDFHVYGDL